MPVFDPMIVSLAVASDGPSRGARGNSNVRRSFPCGCESGETQVVAVGFVENVLRGVEGVDDESFLGGHEREVLQAWKPSPESS
jgi:hypothetical protein